MESILEYNAVVVKTTSQLRKLLPVDRVSEAVATVLFDPKHLSGNCFDNVKHYLFPVRQGNVSFIVTNKSPGEKYLLSEILLQKDELKNSPIYNITFNDLEETMTLKIENEGDKTLRPIGIVEGHAVVLDTHCVYVKNCHKQFEDVEVGMFKWLKETATLISDKTDQTFGSAEENFKKLQKFGETIVQKDDSKSFTENLLITQKANFVEMKYGEKISKGLDLIVDNKHKGSFLEKVIETQKENLCGIEEKHGDLIDSIIGQERTLDSFKAQQISNFKGMKYEEKFSAIRIPFKPRKEFFSKNKRFPLRFNDIEIDFEDLTELKEMYPEDFIDDDVFYVASALVKIWVVSDNGNNKMKLVHYPEGALVEYVHYTTANGKTIYGIQGDFVAIDSCNVTLAEMNYIKAVEKELMEIEIFKSKLYEEAEVKKKMRLNSIKKKMCYNAWLYSAMMGTFKEIIQGKLDKQATLKAQRELEAIQLQKEIQESQMRAEYQQKLIDQEEFERRETLKKDQLDKIDLIENENKARHDLAEVLPYHLKKILTSFVKRDEDLEKFGLKYYYEGKINRGGLEDPKQYKNFFYETKNGWLLDLNNPLVAEVQTQNGNAYIATS